MLGASRLPGGERGAFVGLLSGPLKHNWPYCFDWERLLGRRAGLPWAGRGCPRRNGPDSLCFFYPTRPNKAELGVLGYLDSRRAYDAPQLPSVGGFSHAMGRRRIRPQFPGRAAVGIPLRHA